MVTFVGFAVWFWGLRALPAARAGALIFLQPLSGLVLALSCSATRSRPTFVVGCGLVLVGVYLGGWSSMIVRSEVDGRPAWVLETCSASMVLCLGDDGTPYIAHWGAPGGMAGAPRTTCPDPGQPPLRSHIPRWPAARLSELRHAYL